MAGKGYRNSARVLIDLVVTDRAMPDMSGDKVAEEIKKAQPNVPIVLLTGFGDVMKDAGECPFGIDKILSKPISEHDLLAAIDKVIMRAE